MATTKKIAAVDETELDTAFEAADKDSTTAFTRKLKKPFEFEGVTYTELAFDFEKLTGEDSLAVQNDLLRRGKNVVVMEMNGDFLTMMAARASEPEVGCDMLMALPCYEQMAIQNAARNFFLRMVR